MILSLDIGATTGMAYGDGRNSSTKEVPPPAKNELQPFLVAQAIESEVRKLHITTPIKICLIEGYAYGGNFFNYMQPEITGQVKRYLLDTGIPFVAIPANSMRLAVMGNGRATKMDVKKYCIKHFSVPVRLSDHIYDAFLGLVFMRMYFTNSLSKEHQEMVKHSIVGGQL